MWSCATAFSLAMPYAWGGNPARSVTPASPMVTRRPGAVVASSTDKPSPPKKTSVNASTNLPSISDHFNAARRFEQEGQFKQALHAYLQVLQLAPQHVESLHRTAVVYTQLREYELAWHYYEQALKLQPQNADLLADAGYCRFLSGDLEQAEQLLGEAIKFGPDKPRIVNNYGVVIGFAGRLDDALQTFRQVNTAAGAWMNLSYVYQLRQEWEPALICYQQAQAHDPRIQIPASLIARYEASQTTLASSAHGAHELTPTHTNYPLGDRDSNTHSSQEHSAAESQLHHNDVYPPASHAMVNPLRDASDPPTRVTIAPAPQEASPPVVSLQTIEWIPTDPKQLAMIQQQRQKLADRRHIQGIKGFCLVTLFESRLLIEGREEYAVEYRGTRYTFADQAAMSKFEREPERYTPAAGGLDIVSIHRGQDVLAGSLDYAVWYRDKLYMFSSEETLTLFRANPRLYVSD